MPHLSLCMYIPAMSPLAYNRKSIGFQLVMSFGQEFSKVRIRHKATHQRTQQPNTTDTMVNLSNKRLTTAEKEVLNKGLSFLLNPKKTNSREIMPNLDKLRTDIHRTLHKKQPATRKSKPHTPTTIPPEPHTPSESGRHQRGSRQNITHATETKRQTNIQTKTSPEKAYHP